MTATALTATGRLPSGPPQAGNSNTMLLFSDPTVRHMPATIVGPILVVDVNVSADPGNNTLILPVDERRVDYVRLAVTHSTGEPSSATWNDLLHGAGSPDAGLSPTFCLVNDGNGAWTAYTQMAFGHDGLLFVRLDGAPLSGDPARGDNVAVWLEDLGARHRAHGPQLNNHQRWFLNARDGWEIEQKFTLTSSPDIWYLAVAARADLADGGLPGWVPEFGNDFEQWDFLNHIFEITEPAADRGYIAFIPAVDGSWIIRRKWFDSDATVRREQLTDHVTLPPDPSLDQAIVDRFGVVPAWGASYQRIRYNVMLESLHTGHIFSVMFDRCITDLDVPDLYQIEVEYVRSRTLPVATRTDDDGLMEDFAQVTDWTRRLLVTEHVEAIEHDLSKLTWLRYAAQHRGG